MKIIASSRAASATGRKVSSVRWPRYHGEQLGEMAIMMYLSLDCRTLRQRRARGRDAIRATYL